MSEKKSPWNPKKIEKVPSYSTKKLQKPCNISKIRKSPSNPKSEKANNM